MKKVFRIHGDNIVECERIANLIKREVSPCKCKERLLAPSTISLSLKFHYGSAEHEWEIDLLPGFNKNGRSRWSGDIFKSLRENGSFLDETPDAIISEVRDDTKIILFAIEFCSALQAGNQAWQRSGRAFSVGRTGCPYIYIVEFVKYELNPINRERKALRFPNAAVPYSYINFSRVAKNFVSQVYVRSESFDKELDENLKEFNENDFAESELQRYIVKRMAGINTETEERIIFQKSFNIVKFLSSKFNPNTNFTPQEWQELYCSENDAIDYCVAHNRFNFHKIVTEKGAHGHIKELLKTIDRYSYGLTSKGLPIGIIPKEMRPNFACDLKSIYNGFSDNVVDKLANSDKNLILCLIKGFKPRGDDNRPDRGILPLAAMLSDNETETLTIIYGPIHYANYKLLMDKPRQLAVKNGLWKSILCLSDFLITDAPILSNPQIKDIENIFDVSEIKKSFNLLAHRRVQLESPLFSNKVNKYHEDDVDTGIHYLFSHRLKHTCFEGMCNPPGGDWSGFSLIHNNKEVRWLSLPRVSDSVQGKRPDHIIEIFCDSFKKPILLAIESKEKSADLEADVGIGLKNYINALMKYIPNSERPINPTGNWQRATTKIIADDFIVISAAAYLEKRSQDSDTVYNNSKCDMTFIMSPDNNGWTIKIKTFTNEAEILKDDLININSLSHEINF